MILSNSFPQIDKRETGQKSLRDCLLFFLCTVLNGENFQVPRKTPVITAFKIIIRGLANTESQIFNTVIEISLWPCALFTLRFIINLEISSLILSFYGLLLVLKDFLEGKTLSSLISVHWKAKKSLKKVAFSVQSDRILSFTNRRGINGTLVPW